MSEHRFEMIVAVAKKHLPFEKFGTYVPEDVSVWTPEELSIAIECDVAKIVSIESNSVEAS